MVQTARNDIMNQINQLILYVSRTIPFRSGLDRHLIRAAMGKSLRLMTPANVCFWPKADISRLRSDVRFQG